MDSDAKKARRQRERDELIANFDPRIFISEPYVICPNCSQKEFGVLYVSEQSYSRRCRNCWYDANFKLPSIKKKLIYLDQMMISNIMKSLDAQHKSHSKVVAEPFWLEAHKRLEKLSKFQLVVCPDSHYHQNESLVLNEFPKMKRIYEFLSGGTTLYMHSVIVRLQIQQHFKYWLDGESGKPIDLEPRDIVYGRYNHWQDRMQISIEHRQNAKEVEELRKSKQSGYIEFLKVFERWRTETNKKFKDWYREELAGFGKGIWGAFLRYYRRQAELPQKFLDTGRVDINDVLTPITNDIIQDMVRELHSRGTTGEESYKRINEYFNSKEISHVPTLKIGAMIYAAIARDAAGGRKNPPSPGVFTDVDVIASYLPYCDAMFIDNENARYLKQGPLKDEVNYPCCVFSLDSKQDFLNYLDDIFNQADPEHIKLVKQVYGDNWGEKPYLTILTDDSRSKYH